MRKKTKTLMLVLLLCFGLCGLSVKAHAATEYVEGYLRYTVADGSVTITGYNGRESEVTIPSKIAGVPVNTIASGAFSKASTVTKINLPDTIMTIEEEAFAQGQTLVYNSNAGDSVITTPEEATNQEQLTTTEDPTNSGHPTTSEDTTNPERPTIPEDPTNSKQPTTLEEPTNPKPPTKPKEPTNMEQPTNPGQFSSENAETTQDKTTADNEDTNVQQGEKTGSVEEVDIDDVDSSIVPSGEEKMDSMGNAGMEDKQEENKQAGNIVFIAVTVVIMTLVVIVGLFLYIKKRRK